MSSLSLIDVVFFSFSSLRPLENTSASFQEEWFLLALLCIIDGSTSVLWQVHASASFGPLAVHSPFSLH